MNPSVKALQNVTVLDLTTQIAGPYCTKLLGGFGAEVIKVERPLFGDPMRSAPPFFGSERNAERGIPFLWLNTGKKSITLDLAKRDGVETFRELVRRVDIVIESFMPRVLPDLGLGYEALAKLNPQLIMTSISNYGQNGPYRDLEADEITLYAMSGAMYMTGLPDREPLSTGPATCQYTAGLHAYIGTLMAIFHRHESGEGQHVDVSIQESGIECIEMTMINHLRLGRRGRRALHPMVPWDIFPCRDGWAAVICGPFRNWWRGASLFEEPRLLEEKYRHVKGRTADRARVESLIQPWLDRHTREEVFHAGQANKLAFGYLASFEEVMSSPQHRRRGFFRRLDHPVVGEHEYCAAPFRASATPWRDERAPLLGEHNHSVYGEKLGFSAESIARLEREGIV